MPQSVARRLALRCALLGALVAGAALPGGCAKDTVGPGRGKAVWIGQSISGRVFHNVTTNPIAGVSVTFLAGLNKDALVPLGSATTGENGTYSIVRANQTGTPADFWWFPTSDDGPVTVYLALWASKTGFEPADLRQQILRTPSTDPPTRLLENYQLQMNSALKQISSGS